MFKKSNLIIAIILLSSLKMYSQYSHYFRCVAVENNGDVTLSWMQPVSIDEFISYHFYHATASNPDVFTEIGSSTNYSNTNFTHTGSYSNLMQNFYFIKTLTVTGDPVFSDTLSTIFLQVFNPGNGKAELEWNTLHTPLLPSSNGWYKIYHKYSFSNWDLIDSVQNFEYNEIISVCNDTINYQIKISDESGCESTSNIAGDWFFDINKPPTPVLDSVSIDSNENVVIGWEVNPASDTEGYIIYRNQGGTWITIDIIYGLNNTFYTDFAVDPCTSTKSYSIAAFDSCGNTSPLGIGPFAEGDSIRTICLYEIIYNPCDSTNTINWTSYINMLNQLEGYKIYFSIDAGPFNLLTITSSSVTSFVHQNLSTDNEYCYFIQAYNHLNQITSTSCKKCITTYEFSKPDFIYLRNASVENNDHVELTLFVDTTVYVTGYKILRSENLSGPFDLLEIIPSSVTSEIKYDDYNALVNNKSYYYEIIVIDSCGKDFLTSNISRTIFLTAEAKPDKTNYLEWNDYEGWDGGVVSYNIYRQVNGIFSPDPIISLPFGTNNYSDDISAFTNSQSKYGYYIEAIEGNGETYLFQDTAKSNIAIVNQTSEIYLPNAFAPKGINSEFKPVKIFIDNSGYSFQIFNKWGQLMFETQNPNEGWNGKYKGNYVPLGVYIYYVRYKAEQGNSYEKKGTVTVLY